MSIKTRMRGAVLMLLCMSAVPTLADEGEVKSTWNAQKVILPASQYTPAQTWRAQTMVFNTGRNYQDADYNHVWGTPPDDSQGRHWYEPAYELTNGEQSWQEQTSPFSSDEYYQGQRSTRWITSGIMGDIYLRRSFTLTELPLGTVFLACGHDDGPSEFYLNGTLVFTVSDGWNNDERYLLTDEQKALLKTDGTENILAVHVHQNWGGAYADCGLYEADMHLVTTLLATLDDGPWPCAYYLLNSNSERSSLSAKDWAGICTDERDWAQAYGPLSNSPDQFRTTFWGSDRQPLLVRRHFTLTADQLASIGSKTVELTCSYDENPKVYLNGKMLWQASGWNDNDYAHYKLSNAQKQWLREGDNVVAVSLQTGNGGGHIDLGLSITAPYVPTTIHEIYDLRIYDLPSVYDAIYDLQGRRIDHQIVNSQSVNSKSLYIINGKKVIR